MKYLIDSYLKENSNISSNRLVSNKNPDSDNFSNREPARYLNDNQVELYKSFPFCDKISKSTFIKYLKVDGVYKNPYRITDICEYCEMGKKLRCVISASIKNEQLIWQDSTNISYFLEYFEKKKSVLKNNLIQSNDNNTIIEIDSIKETIKNLKDYQVVNFHKNVAKIQRNAYNFHKSNPENLKDKIMIEVGFKQKIVIGMSPRQVSSEYYNQVQRTCLGYYFSTSTYL